MKGINNKINKKIIFVLSICAILLIFFIGTVKYIRLLYLYNRANVSLMVFRDPNVLNAEILFDENEFGITACSFAIKILFNDGGSLQIHGVNEKGMGYMEIFYVDDFYIGIGNKNRSFVNRTKRLQVWSTITGVKLESITDIVSNYQVISKFTKNIPNSHYYRTIEQIKKLSEHSIDELEVNKEVTNRMLAENLLSFITIEGQDYYLIKSPRKM